MRTHALLWLVLVPLTLTGAARAASAPSADQILSMSLAPEAIEARLARYVPVDLGIDDARAAKELEAVLRPLRRAADFVDHAYWQQRSREGLAMVEALEASRKPSAKNLARLLRIEYGPWDWHANDEPFIGRHARPDGLAFYPSDLSRWEFEAWIDAHPGSIDGFWSPYTVVQRKNGSLEAVPYSKAYQTDLIAAAVALREAAEATDCQSLAAYLRARATSLTTDEYRASEFLWLAHHDCPLDIAIGPYEFYGDRLMGLKTTLGAIIYRQRPRDSERYARVLEAFDGLTANLPIDASLAGRFVTTKPSPIMVADVLYTSGDFRAGYQARAFLLPNDEVVRERAGTRNVILQNVVRAKFDKLVLPVAKRLLAPGDVPKVSADAYRDLLVAWQLAHSVVPAEVELPSGAKTTSRLQLRNRASFIDAVKGEAVALLNYLYLTEGGVFETSSPEAMPLTYLASLFDTVRLAEGTTQTVAKAIVYNYLSREWVFRYDPRGRTFEVNPPAMAAAARKLATEALQILGRGDYDGAGRMIVQFGILPAEVRSKLNDLHDLPIEILPRYVSMPSAKR